MEVKKTGHKLGNTVGIASSYWLYLSDGTNQIRSCCTLSHIGENDGKATWLITGEVAGFSDKHGCELGYEAFDKCKREMIADLRALGWTEVTESIWEKPCKVNSQREADDPTVTKFARGSWEDFF